MRNRSNVRRSAGRYLLLAVMLFTLLIPLSAGAAEVNFAYPKVSTKKGIYVTPGMEEDALELGIRHTTINLSVGDFMPAPAYRNSTHCYSMSYGGTTYWFAKNCIERYDRELNRLAESNVIVTAILLLPRRSDLNYLIYPAARGKSANYYQWNMTDASAVNTLRAIVTFFQRRYSNPNGARIVGWIVGNEVNNSRDWNWGGYIGVDTYVDLYAAEVAEVYRAARSVYGNARIYMCLDHYWSAGNGSYWYAGKTILKKFASRMKARGLGKGTWNIAYHPYNTDLTVTDIMASSSSVTNKAGTRIITMKNLNVLTKFVKKKYSKNCRIILSEQGYSSVTRGRNTSAEQAKSVALAYYIAQHNSMVDSLILHRQVDHSAEAAAGGAFGLYSSWGGENASARKLAWDTYQIVDSTVTNKYTRYAAKQAKKATGKKVKKVFTAKKGKFQATNSLGWSHYYTNGAAGYGALSGISLSGSGYVLRHDASRNANVPWGIRRSGTINCRTMDKLGFGIIVNGATNGSCRLTLRLWSGAKSYFKAAAVIGNGTPNSLLVDLSKWKHRNNITRIDILLTPNGGGWTSGANASVYSIGIRR